MNENIVDIKIPSLDDVNYATSLNEVFDNINKNFSILSNHDFIKGNDGKSIEIVETPFFTNGTINEFGNMLKACIESLGDTKTSIINNGVEYTVWDKFTAENAGVLQLIYNSNAQPVSSLQYVFLDGRFSNNVIGIIDEQSQYDNISDLSCVVVYDKTLNGGSGGFRALNNSISTLYYNSHLGLCWKINGVETGIPAQGIPGKNGKNGKIYIVKSVLTKNNNNLSGEITHIYTKNYGFIDINDVSYNEVYEDIDNSTVLIMANTHENNDTVFYFGSSYIDTNNKLCVICDTESELNKIIEVENITNYFKRIDLMNNTDTNVVNGVFIPINKSNEDGIQPVHLISARYEVENNDNSLDYNDVIITPISDINNLKINNDNALFVDRYIKFYDDVRGCVSYKLINSINSKDTFIKCIEISKILEIDPNVLLTNLPSEFNHLLTEGQKIYQWYNDSVNENHRNIFTIDVNPTSNSIVLLTEEIDNNGILAFDTSKKIIDFVPEFSNSFSTNNKASLNINYDVNITNESLKSANLNVNGEISANSASIGHQTEIVDSDTGMPIYDGNLFVGSAINVGDSTGVIKAGELNLGKTAWTLKTNINPTDNNQSSLIIDNELAKNEGFKSTLVINTDVNVNGTISASEYSDVNVNGTISASESIKINRDRLSSYDSNEAINCGDLFINKAATLVKDPRYNKQHRSYIISGQKLSNDEIFNLIKSPLYINTVINYNNIEYDDIDQFTEKFSTLNFLLQQNPLINHEQWGITINFNNIWYDISGSVSQSFNVIPSFEISNENSSITIDKLLSDFWLNVPGLMHSFSFDVIEKIDIVIQSNTQINKLFVSVKIDGYLTGKTDLEEFISIIPYDLPTKYTKNNSEEEN